MKNFKAGYMQENGSAKKTLSRKEYDEQLQLKFAQMQEEKHEEASERAKKEFAEKTDEEKQEFMNSLVDVEKKPLTYEMMKAIEDHKDITFYAVASTGLNTEDKTKVVKGADGKAEKITIAKDEPTYFKAETYTYDDERKAYVPKDAAAFFIEASKEVVDRALDNADKYDVFANSDFIKEDYLAGKNVTGKEEAKAKIHEYFEKQNGVTISYGAFHENMLRGNDFPIPEESMDLNRVMAEQGKYGTASLNACTNQILGANGDNKLTLSSTSEKLVADVVCLMKLASEHEKEIKFMIREESIDKFSDHDRETLFAADEKVRPDIMPRPRRERTPEERERLQRRLRGGREEREVAPRGFVRREPRREEPRHEEPVGFVRRTPVEKTEEKPRGFVYREPERQTPQTSSVQEPSVQTSSVQMSSEQIQPKAVETPKSVETSNIQDVRDELDDFFSDQDMHAAIQAEKQQAEKQEAVLQKREEKHLEERREEEQRAEKQREEEQHKEEQEVSEKIAQTVTTAGIEVLVKALVEQNKLLQERNELSMKSNEIEQIKVAELQKQTELMEQQAQQMAKLTLLMDNLTKLYSRSDAERLQVEEKQIIHRMSGSEMREENIHPVSRNVPGGAMKGSLSAIIKGVENPEAQEMDINAERRRIRPDRLKEDDDIGKP